VVQCKPGELVNPSDVGHRSQPSAVPLLSVVRMRRPGRVTVPAEADDGEDIARRRRAVHLWLRFNRGEAICGRQGCGPDAVRMKPWRSSRDVWVARTTLRECVVAGGREAARRVTRPRVSLSGDVRSAVG
jgi:hypothetical protein